jgi:hypothetical protein
MALQEFNLPDKDDPDFADKMVSLVRQLFEKGEKGIQDFTPIEDPDQGTQIGSVWFDTVSQKLKVKTTNKYE